MIQVIVPDGYEMVGVIRGWITDKNILVYNAFWTDNYTVEIHAFNFRGTTTIKAMAYASVLFIKK